MKKIKYGCFCLLCLCLGVLKSTAQKNDAGAASFLLISPESRVAGMGNAGTAPSLNGGSIFRNASAVSFSDYKGSFSVNYTPWMRELVSGKSLNSASGFYKLNDKHAIAAGFRYFMDSKVYLYDENGSSTGTFKPKEWAVDLAYSYLFTEKLSASLTVRYISSDMGTADGADVGNAVAFDLGLSYLMPLRAVDGGNWSLGLQLYNIGTKISYLEKEYDIPGQIKAGCGLYLPFSADHELSAALDFAYRIIPGNSSHLDAGIGVEYTFLGHGILRGGYHFGNKDYGNESYGTLGAGVKYSLFFLNAAYWLTPSDSSLKNTFSLSLGVNF